MKTLLIVWHSMTGGSEALARAAASGAQEITVRLLHADARQDVTDLRRNATRAKHVPHGLGRQMLAVDENAVAVEDDEVDDGAA